MYRVDRSVALSVMACFGIFLTAGIVIRKCGVIKRGGEASRISESGNDAQQSYGVVSRSTEVGKDSKQSSSELLGSSASAAAGVSLETVTNVSEKRKKELEYVGSPITFSIFYFRFSCPAG